MLPHHLDPSQLSDKFDRLVQPSLGARDGHVSQHEQETRSKNWANGVAMARTTFGKMTRLGSITTRIKRRRIGGLIVLNLVRTREAR